MPSVFHTGHSWTTLTVWVTLSGISPHVSLLLDGKKKSTNNRNISRRDLSTLSIRWMESLHFFLILFSLILYKTCAAILNINYRQLSIGEHKRVQQQASCSFYSDHVSHAIMNSPLFGFYFFRDEKFICNLLSLARGLGNAFTCEDGECALRLLTFCSFTGQRKKIINEIIEYNRGDWTTAHRR